MRGTAVALLDSLTEVRIKEVHNAAFQIYSVVIQYIRSVLSNLPTNRLSDLIFFQVLANSPLASL